jgi:hypothetical protein
MSAWCDLHMCSRAVTRSVIARLQPLSPRLTPHGFCLASVRRAHVHCSSSPSSDFPSRRHLQTLHAEPIALLPPHCGRLTSRAYSRSTFYPPLPLAPVCDFATNVSYSHPSCAQCNNVSNYFDGSCSVAGINTTASCPPGECPTSPNVPSAMFPFCESTYVAVAASPHDPFPAKEECQRWPQLISPLSHKLTATGRFIFILLCLVGGLQEWRQTRSSTHAA